MITENKAYELKKKASEVRDQIIQAKATMTEVESTINDLEIELKGLGIKNVIDVDAEIEQINNQIEELYQEAYSKIEKFL